MNVFQALDEYFSRALTYKIYKGVRGKFGAFQFRVRPASLESDDWKERKEGLIFIEAAPATAPDVYAWWEKITFSLRLHEVGNFIWALRTRQEARAYHDSSKSAHTSDNSRKSLSLKPLEKPGTFGLGLSESGPNQGDSQARNVYITLSEAESTTLCNLFVHAQGAMMGWR
jgi:hypothetical protein